MSRTTNESNIDEIIEIVQAVKRHLQEDNCVHSLKTIITEAYRSKNGLRPITTSDTETTIPEPPKNDHV